LRLVPDGARVLELSVGAGGHADCLTARGCRLVSAGVDDWLAGRRPDDGERYDVVLAADVLDRVVDPSKLVASLAEVLAERGYLAFRVPNVAHGDVRLELLAGRFDESAAARGRLHHFTRSTLERMLEDAGFRLVFLDRIRRRPETAEVDAPEAVRRFVDADPEAFTLAFVGVALPREYAETGLPAALAQSLTDSEAALAQLRAAPDEEVVRLTELAHQAYAAELAANDKLVRVEHRLAEAENDRRALARELEIRDQSIETIRTRLAAVEAELEAWYASRLWRVGRFYRRLLPRNRR
jgi:SAM-dependent methyltransferase